MSEKGTHANVGFRPTLVYTSDDINTFKFGSTPVDLFFLFDASASQDNQIQAMIDSAQEIIKQFAGDPTKVSGGSQAEKEAKAKAMCNVGSALFLGPQIRMMCGSLYNEQSGSRYVKNFNRNSDINGYTKRAMVQYPRPDPNGVGLVFNAWSAESQ